MFISVSVIGNFNKGKSRLLSKLSGMSIAQGFNQKTKGISLIYYTE